MKYGILNKNTFKAGRFIFLFQKRFLAFLQKNRNFFSVSKKCDEPQVPTDYSGSVIYIIFFLFLFIVS
ncbi:MAG: hypothetical protein A7316_07230 [Candidatus Altiarchaeales archaeon WOR_SM1_86-2]|nr:MAG: hypothetical protein A7316_07230 [Candidatus Altiarchaeales archaeon WOR_SM1_86-2]